MTTDCSALIVDYGSGNLLSVARALERCGAEVKISGDPTAIAQAQRLVVPGVGAFGDCVDNLKMRELFEPVRAFAVGGRPFLGVCVGMQMLFEESSEFGRHRGLGLIPGHVDPIPTNRAEGGIRKVPHIGWSPLLKPRQGAPWKQTVLADIEEGNAAYFVHSYAARPTNPAHCLAECDYLGERLCAAVQINNMYGCQFHPEKSGPVGLRILSSFLGM